MTNKQFFIKVLEGETPTFIKVLKALPQDKLSFMPEGKGRSAKSLAFQLANQPFSISQAAVKGVIDGENYKEPENVEVADIVSTAEKSFSQLKNDLAKVSDDDWENKTSKLEFPGGKWETKRFEMAWGFLMDAIHHRGQLSTYLRAMGAKVPSIYGGSADERPQM